MNESFNKVRPQAQEIKKQKRQQSFTDYWNEMAPPWAEKVSESLGVLDKVKEKGVDGLLTVHSFRLLTTAQLSLAYANVYERTTFASGNSRDMHHVACASACPIFVCHDKQLVNVLSRMPIDGLEVIDLNTLLSGL